MVGGIRVSWSVVVDLAEASTDRLHKRRLSKTPDKPSFNGFDLVQSRRSGSMCITLPGVETVGHQCTRGLQRSAGGADRDLLMIVLLREISYRRVHEGDEGRKGRRHRGGCTCGAFARATEFCSEISFNMRPSKAQFSETNVLHTVKVPPEPGMDQVYTAVNATHEYTLELNCQTQS